MRARECVPAVLAKSAGTRIGSAAQKSLANQKREPLLSHARGAMQKQGARESVARDGIVESRAEGDVTVEGKERHGRKVRFAVGSAQFMTTG